MRKVYLSARLIVHKSCLAFLCALNIDRVEFQMDATTSASAVQENFITRTDFVVISSKMFRPSVIVLPVGPSTCRLLNFVRYSADYRTQYYSCKRCYNLNVRKPANGEFYAVQGYVVDKVLYMKREAQHHPLCSDVPIAKAQAMEIERDMRLQLRSGQGKPRRSFEQVKLH